MSDQRASGIAWTDETWNPLRGCSRVSAGCVNCYAETMAARFAGPGKPYEGTIKDGRWNGQIRLVHDKLDQPARWRRPRRIFVNSMSDLFHHNVPNDYIAAVFGAMAAAPHHTFQVLTKRPDRARKWFERWYPANHTAGRARVPELIEHAATMMVDAKYSGDVLFKLANKFAGVDTWPLPNVWIGASIENEHAANERIHDLCAVPAAVRFLSCEPLLGEVNLGLHGILPHTVTGSAWIPTRDRINWVIVGGESGPGARQCDIAWIRDILRQCREADVVPFIKQMGENSIEIVAGDDQRIPFGDRHGADPAEWPNDLQVQVFPE